MANKQTTMKMIMKAFIWIALILLKYPLTKIFLKRALSNSKLKSWKIILMVLK
jgi:multisubunit Na+/H+ antiporter MnhG subunit